MTNTYNINPSLTNNLAEFDIILKCQSLLIVSCHVHGFTMYFHLLLANHFFSALNFFDVYFSMNIL